MHELVERYKHESRLPEIAGEHCVHALMETASCQACIDVCPQQAWLLDDDALSLDTQACDGCGLCVPVCPEGAISCADHAVVLREKQGELVAFCACEFSEQGSDDGILPCIHSLRLQDILLLFNKGVRRLTVATGDCCQCNRSGKNDLSDRISSLNSALIATGIEGIRLDREVSNEWRRLLDETTVSPAGPAIDRRNFLRALVNAGLERKVETPDLLLLGDQPFRPAGQLLQEKSPRTSWPSFPEIQAGCCNGCDACVRLCPHEALVFEQVDSGARYRIEPQNCTGCAICVDVCEKNAVSMRHWQVAAQLEIALVSSKCKACGSPFHLPAVSEGENNTLCRICSSHNHYKNLHQVLE